MDKRLDPQKVWDYTKQQLLERMPFNLSVMDAINAAVPITVDDKLLVLGLAKDQVHNRGHFMTPDRQNLIERILQEALGEGFTYTVIDGTTQADWEMIHERRDIAKRAAEVEFADKVRTSQMKKSFNDMLRELYQRQSSMSGRKFPHMRAVFLLDALPLVQKVEEAMRADPNINEIEFHRQFSRVFDKLSIMLEMPPASIAIEYIRYCREQGGGGEFDTHASGLDDGHDADGGHATQPAE